MTSVPKDLKKKWFVVPRPEGTRCFMLAKRGWTSVRKQNGTYFDEFSSLLPGGSRKSYHNTNTTVLDCIYNEKTETYWVLNILVWGSMELYDKDTEFRSWWLTKLNEVAVSKESDYNHRIIKALEYLPTSKENLQKAYKWTNYGLDGLLFVHRESLYEPGCMSSLTLIWKDKSTSPWWIDSDDGKKANVVEYARLRVDIKSGACTTLDGKHMTTLDQ
eukprot:UN34641